MVPSNGDLWGVVLAGGEGTRLLPLTRHIAGSDCPKQFCVVTGGGTLLGQTLDRIARLIPAERTLAAATPSPPGTSDVTFQDPFPMR